MIRVPGRQIVYILRIAGQPVDCREMSGVGQGFVQPPETPHETLGIHGHRFREVAALRGHRADDGHGPLGLI